MHDVARPVSNRPMQSKPKRRRKGIVIAIALLVTICVFAFGIKILQIVKMTSTPMVMPPTTVSSVTVKEEDWAPRLTAVGSVSAVQGAVVSAELAGVVSEINFENGGEAKKGEVLMKLDASQEEALLRSAEAEAQLAQTDLERSRDLAMKKVVSSAELDSAQSKFRRLNAVVDQVRSSIAKKTLIAPFDGQLGIRQVNVGQMINAGQQVVPLTSLDPVFADFALPQQYLGQLTPGLEVQATLDNSDHALRPGMFAKAEVMLPEKHKTLVVPGSAISYAPFGDSVFVIEKKKDEKTGKESQMIRQQFVRVGEGRGDLVAITQGLKAGETVVSTGVFKLRNGMTVTINNDLAPNPQVNPNPIDS